jgi:Predicted transcriptional regulator
MSDGTATHMIAVLGAIGNGQFTVEEIASHLPMDRRNVSSAAGRLITRGLIERIETGVFRLSDEGRAFLAAGRTIKCGPKGKRTGVTPPLPDTLRQRAWKVMQVSRRFTIDDLLRAAARGDRADSRSNLQHYLKALTLSGHIAVLPRRIPGRALTSNGFRQWVLNRNTGPIAPVARPKDRVTYDHNTREAVSWRE